MTSENDWDELERLWDEQRDDNRFSSLDSPLVPGEGSDNPIAFIIGEAPTAQEAMKGRPFIGAAGSVQRQLMSFAGLWAAPALTGPEGKTVAEPNCWLTNVIKFRPPRNRKPYWVEMMAARPYLLREWKAVGRPTLIIPVGKAAFSAVAGRQMPIFNNSGQPISKPRADGRVGKIHIWPMIHPAFGLRQPAIRELIERDWERLAAWMHNENYS